YWLGGERIEQTGEALNWLLGELARIRESGEVRERILAKGRNGSPLTPAAACALDTALLDLEAQERGIALAALLGATAIEPIELCALLTSRSPVEIVREAKRARIAGYRCLKLKVGARTIEDEIRNLKAVREAVSDECSIRLDANRAWTFESALSALSRFHDCRIELVEEPLSSPRPGELAKLRDLTGIPIALDESINSKGDLDKCMAEGGTDYVVLKAARIGGPTRLVEMATLAKSAGMRAVVTDSLETAVGMSLAIHIAAALAPPRSATGLGGVRVFSSMPASGLEFQVASALIPCGPGLRVAALSTGGAKLI
ncbi:MAG TPA: o-succinylbenzoate synthase, partial [Candidatus Binataceae bacterium]|nr:o-succinylbenzoate synthase [Candidatus Binataceae bacterium]